MKDLANTSRWLSHKRHARSAEKLAYKKLEVFGPEHEFSLVNSEMKPMPIAEEVINEYYGRISNCVRAVIYSPKFDISKEFPLQLVEIKARKPFSSPEFFEESMQAAMRSFLDFIDKKYHAHLLGTGMHPLLRLEETGTRPHDKIAQEFSKVFPLRRHGWLNIQSFQLNLPYSTEEEAVSLHNVLAYLCAYLPAISASSPICEGYSTLFDDFRLYNYKMKCQEIPSITGDVVPEYISSFEQFRSRVSDRYSRDLSLAGVSIEDFASYVNQRMVVFKFARNAIEIRAMDEQECIKSDVALSCFIRSTIRGLMALNNEPLPHQILVNDYNSIIKNGLEAEVLNPKGKTAGQICQCFLNLSLKYADEQERKYLWIIEKRIKEGNLSKLIRRRILNRSQKTTLDEAIISIYSKLAKCASDNQPYF
jgi:gamma-glutamyl:cysteine ligase YbdK (ATP-grasp superfamily)